MSSVTATITARWNGGQRPGPPTFGVLHDAETPLEAGYARAIANMFATTSTQKSATYMVDPVDTVQLLDESLIAWHCGNANPRSIGVEQSGYAQFTEAEWSTDAAFQQEERVAQLMREIRDRHGIGLYWMTDQQLRDAHAGRIVGGWATHEQCSRVIGGSTHTDPAPNYPLARVMARANANVQEDDMFDAPDREAVAECRRMLAVLLGAQAAASPAEAKTLAQIAATTDNSAEARRMLAVMLGAAKPAAGEQVLSAGSADPVAIAAAIKTALGADLAADVASHLTVTAA
jgi:hypothetical protein